MTGSRGKRVSSRTSDFFTAMMPAIPDETHMGVSRNEKPQNHRDDDDDDITEVLSNQLGY